MNSKGAEGESRRRGGTRCQARGGKVEGEASSEDAGLREKSRAAVVTSERASGKTAKKTRVSNIHESDPAEQHRRSER